MTTPAYQIYKTKKARRLSITVYENGHVRVSVPYRISKKIAYIYVASKMGWIQKCLASQQRVMCISYPFTDTLGYKKYAPKARQALTQRTQELADQTGLSFKRVSIRNQKTRWGSCSTTGTLSFNYKLYFLPAELRDYVIIHELCHTKHMNHGPRFWNKVARFCPNYKEYEKQLRRFKL